MKMRVNPLTVAETPRKVASSDRVAHRVVVVIVAVNVGVTSWVGASATYARFIRLSLSATSRLGRFATLFCFCFTGMELNGRVGSAKSSPLARHGAAEHVHFLAGDQLSITRIRAPEPIRTGHENGRDAMYGSVGNPGLFHANTADLLGTLSTHIGKPDTIPRDPDSDSLSCENTCLDCTEGEKTPLTGFWPPSELPAPATLKFSTRLPGPETPNPSTNLSPPLGNPAATPGEDVGKGILVDESIVREPEEVRLRGMDAREEPSDGDEGSEEVVSSGRVALSL